MEERISLLWKNENKSVQLPEGTIKDLDIDYLCDYISKNDREKKIIYTIMTSLCQENEDITYRAQIFDDLMKNMTLTKELGKVVDELKILDEIQNSRMNAKDYSSLWQLINRLKELNSYITCIESLRNCLISYHVVSEGLLKIKALVEKVYKDSGFEYLKEDIGRLTEDVSKVKSLTLGVNLNSDLNPCEVKLLSINHTKFKDEDNSVLKSFATAFAGTFATTVIRGNAHEIDPLMNALTKRAEELLHITVEDIKASLNKYINISGYQITQLIPELIFYLRFAEMTSKLMERGFYMTRPTLSLWGKDDKNEDDKSKETRLEGMYNIKLGIYQMDKSECFEQEQIVTNNLDFTKHHKQYILTGPNRGGKTILTQGVGLLFLLAQNGLYVPAKNALIYPVDMIYTHFPADENTTVELGRLGEEAARAYGIIKKATVGSLILLNESFSTTSFSEGLYIAKDVIKAMNYMGARVIYNTHMHELAVAAVKLNADYCETIGESGCDSVVSLVMGIEGGQRNYKVEIAPPAGRSYASDIAVKYGVYYENMKKEIDKKAIM